MIRTSRHSDSQLLTVLRDQRRLRRLSQSELGSILKMPQSHLARIETGAADVRLSTLTEIARVLDLEPMLIPKHLVPAVQYMMDPQEHPQAASTKLVGNAPDEPKQENSDDLFGF